jgi:mannose-6-phosphate isomerase-like protein (cupin superfamily)
MRSRSLKDLIHFDPDSVRRETLFESDALFSEVLCFDAKQHVGPMEDAESDALFTVLAGEGRFNVGRRSRTLKQWGVVLVPAGTEVTVINLHDEPLVVMMVAAPPPAGEADEEARDGDATWTDEDDAAVQGEALGDRGQG